MKQIRVTNHYSLPFLLFHPTHEFIVFCMRKKNPRKTFIISDFVRAYIFARCYLVSRFSIRFEKKFSFSNKFQV